MCIPGTPPLKQPVGLFNKCLLFPPVHFFPVIVFWFFFAVTPSFAVSISETTSCRRNRKQTLRASHHSTPSNTEHKRLEVALACPFGYSEPEERDPLLPETKPLLTLGGHVLGDFLPLMFSPQRLFGHAPLLRLVLFRLRSLSILRFSCRWTAEEVARYLIQLSAVCSVT